MAMAVAVETTATTATYCRLSANNIPNIQPKVKSSPIEIVKRVANFQFTSPFLLSLFPMFDSCQHTFCSDFRMSADRGRLIDILWWNFVFDVKTTTLHLILLLLSTHIQSLNLPRTKIQEFFFFSLFPLNSIHRFSFSCSI